jgi:DNA replication protein DnaC
MNKNQTKLDSMNTYTALAQIMGINSELDDLVLRTPAPHAPVTPVSTPIGYTVPRIGFPARHEHPDELWGYEWQTAYQTALDIVESGGIVIAYGRRGTGKTQIACELAKHAKFPNSEKPRKEWAMQSHPEHRPAIYCKAMEIFIDLKNGYGRPKEKSEKYIIDKLSAAAFLVIDEAHVRGETKYEDDKLTHIMDKRYDAMLPTMLITNVTRQDFAAQLSPSIISRIRETGGGIECNWASYRKTPNQTVPTK